MQTHHATLGPLIPGTSYVYAVSHEGVRPEYGTFDTAPRGRAAIRFTSFGDQAVPYLTATTAPMPAPGPVPPGTMLPGYVNDAIGSFSAGDIVSAVETLAPTFHLINGDLCYADISGDHLRVWNGFFANNTRSARYRPWMPTAGNHENEGNGPIGYDAYRTRFLLPGNGEQSEFQGMWYAFTVGSVRVVCISNDDVALQNLGRSVYDYSGGRQLAWLQAELAGSRASSHIDWIVVCMHQTMISTADLNGADLGIRQQFGQVFDQYGVDLVLCGHEHHYERSLPVRGADPSSPTLTPQPVPMTGPVVDSSQGTVHMLIGGGGTSVPSNTFLFDPPECKVIVGATPPDSTGRRQPVYIREQANWSAFRDKNNPYGFASFDVDPGRFPGDTTQITATYYAVQGPGMFTPVDQVTLQRQRSDHPRQTSRTHRHLVPGMTSRQ